MIAPNPKKEEFAKEVCMFLAEQLRTHRISLERSADISQKVIDHLNLIDTEEDFLKFIMEIGHDFEELAVFAVRLEFYQRITRRQKMENSVREFVISIMPQDVQLALSVLLEAVKDEVQMRDLTQKFPQFNEFIQKEHQAPVLMKKNHG